VVVKSKAGNARERCLPVFLCIGILPRRLPPQTFYMHDPVFLAFDKPFALKLDCSKMQRIVAKRTNAVLRPPSVVDVLPALRSASRVVKR
jgi:hypothetical protein